MLDSGGCFAADTPSGITNLVKWRYQRSGKKTRYPQSSINRLYHSYAHFGANIVFFY